jgi:hypothetical protein
LRDHPLYIFPLTPSFLLLPLFLPHSTPSNQAVSVRIVRLPVYARVYVMYLHVCTYACMPMCVCVSECMLSQVQLRTCRDLCMRASTCVCMYQGWVIRTSETSHTV